MMRFNHLHAFFLAVSCLLCIGPVAYGETPRQSIRLLGIAEVPGDSHDLSGLKDFLEQGVPHNQFGGISAVDYLGENRFLLLPDRGPGDGANSYRCRFHVAKIDIDVNREPVISFDLERTVILKDGSDRPFNGLAANFVPGKPLVSQRFDPEGVRVLGDGNLVISDEYGPRIDRFDPNGRWLENYSVPQSFMATYLSASPDEEATENLQGRQPNGGLEGLAVTPNGMIYALIQRPLIQDSDPAEPGSDKRVGIGCRLLGLDPNDGSTTQYVYHLDSPDLGQSVLLAINNTEFLVFERDSKFAGKSKSKRVYKIDIANASDVSHVPSLPAKGLGGGLTPVTKTLFLDMLDPHLAVPIEKVAGKIEGMTFGPPQPDGSHTLVVISDNDFLPENPTMIYVFAIDQNLLDR